jgi:hypothetical protein
MHGTGLVQRINSTSVLPGSRSTLQQIRTEIRDIREILNVPYYTWYGIREATSTMMTKILASSTTTGL